MDALLAFMESHGYAALYVLGIAEFAGLPVASTPIVVAAGAIAASGAMDPLWVVASVAAGGLTADLAWFGLARWRGSAIVDSACGLSSNPKVCVLAVSSRISQVGAPYLLIGKFIPGVSAMLAAASGLAGIGPRRFLLVDAIALVLWGTVYTILGWIFAAEVEPVLIWITGHLGLVGTLLLAGLAGAALLRWWKAGMHDHTAGGVAGPDGSVAGPDGSVAGPLQGRGREVQPPNREEGSDTAVAGEKSKGMTPRN